MSGNVLLTIDQITRENLVVLANQLTVTKGTTREYDDSFAKTGAKIGSTLRIRKPAQYKTRRGPAYQPQASVDQFVNLTVSTQYGVDLDFTTAEMTMQLDDLSKRYLMPAMSQLGTDIDTDVCKMYKNFYQSVGVPGTIPGTSAVLQAANQKMTEVAIPKTMRSLHITPAANTSLIEGIKGLYHPDRLIDSQFMTGAVYERFLGYERISETQNLETHVCGQFGTTNSVAVSVSDGATSIVMTTNGSTLNQGDVFNIAGVYAANPQKRASTGQLQDFVVTAPVVASGGQFIVPIAPVIYGPSNTMCTVAQLPQAGAVVTFRGAPGGSYPQILAFQKDCVAFATADLVIPRSVVESSVHLHEGIRMRMIVAYDPNSDRELYRTDILAGAAVLRGEGGVRMWS